MSSVTVEFLRPDGSPLRYIDAGLDFIETAGIPLANAERPIRVESDHSKNAAQDLFGNHQSAAIPLPDGTSTNVRVGGGNLSLTTQRLAEKCVVVIDGVEHDLTVTVSVQLTRRDHRPLIDASAIGTQAPNSTSPLQSLPSTADSQRSNCPNCGGELKVVRFRLGSGFKEFIGCSNFPTCRYGRNS